MLARRGERGGVTVVLEAAALSKHFQAKRGIFGGDREWCARSTGSRSR